MSLVASFKRLDGEFPCGEGSKKNTSTSLVPLFLLLLSLAFRREQLEEPRICGSKSLSVAVLASSRGQERKDAKKERVLIFPLEREREREGRHAPSSLALSSNPLLPLSPPDRIRVRAHRRVRRRRGLSRCRGSSKHAARRRRGHRGRRGRRRNRGKHERRRRRLRPPRRAQSARWPRQRANAPRRGGPRAEHVGWWARGPREARGGEVKGGEGKGLRGNEGEMEVEGGLQFFFLFFSKSRELLPGSPLSRVPLTAS